MRYTSSMTMKRNTKTEVQVAATSTERVRIASPSQRAKYGTHLPLAEGRAFAVQLARPVRHAGRDRAAVAQERVTARRRAGMSTRAV